jgi:hypothetical protein
VRFFCLALASLLISACAATGPLYEELPPPPDGYARIVIYRAYAFASGAHSSPFEIDKKHVADLRNDGYTYVLVRPGAHTLHCGGKDIAIDVAARGTYYFRYQVSMGTLVMAGAVPFVVNSAAASSVEYDAVKQEISSMHYQAPVLERLD